MQLKLKRGLVDLCYGDLQGFQAQLDPGPQVMPLGLSFSTSWLLVLLPEVSLPAVLCKTVLTQFTTSSILPSMWVIGMPVFSSGLLSPAQYSSHSLNIS